MPHSTSMKGSFQAAVSGQAMTEIGKGFGRYWEGFRALQRTKASDGGTRGGSGTELWGFAFWPGRNAAVHSCNPTQATAGGAGSSVMIEAPSLDLSSFGGRAATR